MVDSLDKDKKMEQKAAVINREIGSLKTIEKDSPSVLRNIIDQIDAFPTDNTGLMTASSADVAFAQRILKYLSPAERRFYDSLSGPQTLVMLDEKGQILLNKEGHARTETIDGTLLQADFAHIKYHTLDKEHVGAF